MRKNKLFAAIIGVGGVVGTITAALALYIKAPANYDIPIEVETGDTEAYDYKINNVSSLTEELKFDGSNTHDISFDLGVDVKANKDYKQKYAIGQLSVTLEGDLIPYLDAKELKVVGYTEDSYYDFYTPKTNATLTDNKLVYTIDIPTYVEKDVNVSFSVSLKSQDGDTTLTEEELISVANKEYSIKLNYKDIESSKYPYIIGNRIGDTTKYRMVSDLSSKINEWIYEDIYLLTTDEISAKKGDVVAKSSSLEHGNYMANQEGLHSITWRGVNEAGLFSTPSLKGEQALENTAPFIIFDGFKPEGEKYKEGSELTGYVKAFDNEDGKLIPSIKVITTFEEELTYNYDEKTGLISFIVPPAGQFKIEAVASDSTGLEISNSKGFYADLKVDHMSNIFPINYKDVYYDNENYFAAFEITERDLTASTTEVKASLLYENVVINDNVTPGSKMGNTYYYSFSLENLGNYELKIEASNSLGYTNSYIHNFRYEEYPKNPVINSISYTYASYVDDIALQSLQVITPEGTITEVFLKVIYNSNIIEEKILPASSGGDSYNFSYTFTQVGAYVLEYHAINSLNLETIFSKNYTIEEKPYLPSIVIDSHSGDHYVGDEVLLYVTGSDPQDGTIFATLTKIVDPNGDEVEFSEYLKDETSKETVYKFTPSLVGNYIAHASAEDADGNITNATSTIIVRPIPPTITYTGLYTSIKVGDTHKFSFTIEDAENIVSASLRVCNGSSFKDHPYEEISVANNVYTYSITATEVGNFYVWFTVVDNLGNKTRAGDPTITVVAA